MTLEILKYTPEYRRAVVSAVDAERLLRERYGITNIVYRGDELGTPCPLPFGNHKHGDRSPSFSVNKKSGLCNCYVCGGGSLAWLVMQMEDKTYNEAIEILERFQHEMSDEEFRSLVDSFGEKLTKEESERTTYDSLVSMWASKRHDYWSTRGITRQTEAHWSLGYSESDNRIVVPHKFGDKWVGYQMRSLDGSLPKWKNSPDFPRATTLFNYDSAKHYDTIIVVEAAMSAIWLWQLGYRNVVATFGASITEEQCRLLRRADEVIAWLDPDEAGEHGLGILVADLSQHTTVRRVIAPDGDPNELDEQTVHKMLSPENLEMVF